MLTPFRTLFRSLPLLLLATLMAGADANVDPVIDGDTPWERGDSIVVIGDTYPQQGAVSWFDQINRALTTRRGEMGVTMERRGGRMKTVEVFAQGEAAQLRPTMVIISVASSELLQQKPQKPATREEYETGLANAVRQLQSLGTLVVLATPIPADGATGGAATDAQTAAYAEAVRAVASANSLEVADFRAALEPLGRGVIGQMGINQAAHNALATVAARAIADTLRKAPMTLEVTGGEYLGTITVPIIPHRVRNPAAVEIRYSLNGKDPHPKSGTLYKRPIKISTSCTLIAIATDPTTGQTARAEVRFEKGKGRAPDRIGKRATSLNFEFYPGSFKSCKDMMARTGEPQARGLAMGPDIQAVIEDETSNEPLPLNTDFGLVFTGFVDVPLEGVYTFSVRSSDGSRLFIGDQLVVDNDGIHGPREVVGKIGLREGPHALRIEYFKGPNQQLRPLLEVSLDGPTIRKTRIPDLILFRDAAAKPKPRTAPAPAEEAKDKDAKEKKK